MSTAILHTIQPLFACAVCTGSLDDVQSKAANMGIWMMLLVLLAVFSGLISFMVSLARRSREAMAEVETNE